MAWLGVDVGGTFTDLVLYDPVEARLTHHKTSSTTGNHADGILTGLSRLGLTAGGLERLIHGTTVATNTVLERNGARLGIVTTAGFRDVLIVGRGNRTILYDIRAQRPPGLVSRTEIFEVDERMRADGSVHVPLDLESIDRLAETLQAANFEAVAVCFLHAYANPDHEQKVVEKLREALPNLWVCASHEVLPEYREYERFATTAVNAYVAPRMARYLDTLTQGLQAASQVAPVSVMTSSGGAWPSRRIAHLPVNSILSGPAAGVIGAAHVGAAANFPDLITFDMGGTSTDTCLIRAGEIPRSTEGKVGGLPNQVRQIEINTVGAGGGSIARLNHGGALEVGPASAGAQPGPACYGRGGTKATVTDANVVLGRVVAQGALADEMSLDTTAAEAAVARVADELGVPIDSMAEGIITLAVARMTSAVKEISIMRGIDPRDFALFAYGGAGPLHAALIARELGMDTVVIPPLPGNFSAFGLLVADNRVDLSRSLLTRLATLAPTVLQTAFRELEAEARAQLVNEGWSAATIRFEQTVDVRLVGQAFDLSVPLEADLNPTVLTETIDRDFRALYERRYANRPTAAAEVVCIRLSASVPGPKPALRLTSSGSSAATPVTLRFDGRPLDAQRYERDGLTAESQVLGPALISESGSVTLIPPDWSAKTDPMGNLILKRSGGKRRAA